MTSILHKVTYHAITEILERYGFEGKYGRILTDKDLSEIAHDIAELFEKALELRQMPKFNSLVEQNES
jgi:hypothetical protein